MKILIVEDVTLVADRIASLAKGYFGTRAEKIVISYSYEDALCHLKEQVFDLILLDLHLNGLDGFELLKEPVTAAIHTVVITANKAEAVRAFDLGVTDFIAKPIREARFQLAMKRFEEARKTGHQLKAYLAVKTMGYVVLILIEEIDYIQAAKNYSNIHLKDGSSYLHAKSINRILNALPQNFVRIHRSYIVGTPHMKRFINRGAGKYEVELASGRLLPMNRDSFQAFTKLKSTPD